MFFSIWYKLWTFKNPIFNSHFYSGVCWLLSPTFNFLFSTSEHLYFLPSSSLPNPILWIFVGVWAMENTLGTDNCVDLSSLESPFLFTCSPLSPSSLSYSSCNSVNLFGGPSRWKIFFFFSPFFFLFFLFLVFLSYFLLKSSNTPLLFLNFHFHFTITLQKKKREKSYF